MDAVRDAMPVGRFPVVIWTPRYGTTAAQAVLSEYLASHGFMVAFARPAAPAPMPFELADAGAKRAELAARVGDMRAALEHLRTLPNADATAVGVLAWSYTGEMATAFRSANRRSTSGPHGVRGYEAVADMMLRLLRRHVAARSTVPLTELMLTSGLRADTARVIDLGAASR